MDRISQRFPKMRGRRNQQVFGYPSGGDQQMLAIGRVLMKIFPNSLLLAN
jgi:ABC-type branched-subunit amino acid transport system ATPase component